ncbi:MAG: GNAT family N-acetyltransferase [Pyrinomonadaceae bacterium]
MQMLSDLELIERHVNALFTHNGGGRLCRVNEPDGAESPRFFLGRTAEGNIFRTRFDLPDALTKQLKAACTDEPEAGDPRRKPAQFTRYLDLLETQSPIQKVWMGPAYAFPETFAQVSRDTVSVTSENIDILRGGFEDWFPDVPIQQPFSAFLRDGQAVSICSSVRITPKAHEAGVETLNTHRGNGYAADVTAGWANAVRKLGCTPLYSTSWKNVASQRVAEKLGLQLFGVTFHVR